MDVRDQPFLDWRPGLFRHGPMRRAPIAPIACIVALAGGGCEGETLSVLTPSGTFDPTSLDFGTVLIASQETRTTRFVNTSPVPLTIDNVVSTVPDFTLVVAEGEKRGGPMVGHRFPPGSTFDITATFTPEQAGLRETVMTVFTEGLEIPLSLSGEGAVPPQGVVRCQPSPVDFGPVQRGTTVTLAVQCTAVGGTADVTAARVVVGGGSFDLPAPPALPTTLLAGESLNFDVRYTARGLPRVENGRLSVEHTTADGNAEALVVLRGEVIPPDITNTAISIRLDWNTDMTDVDLHFVAPGGTTFQAPLDCYFSNSNPDWGVQREPTDDPFLDVDDTNGFGPENINLSQTGPGRYGVYVHYWRSPPRVSSTAQVQIFLNGATTPAYTASQQLECNDLWFVGEVDWNGTTGTFSPVGNIQRLNRGNCL